MILLNTKAVQSFNRYEEPHVDISCFTMHESVCTVKHSIDIYENDAIYMYIRSLSCIHYGFYEALWTGTVTLRPKVALWRESHGVESYWRTADSFSLGAFNPSKRHWGVHFHSHQAFVPDATLSLHEHTDVSVMQAVRISSELKLAVALAVCLGMCREALQCCTVRGETDRERSYDSGLLLYSSCQWIDDAFE